MIKRSTKTRFMPGLKVPASGVYRVIHSRHRASHLNSLLEDQLFPVCNKCGNDVRFELVLASDDSEGLDRPTLTSPSLLLVDDEPNITYTLKLVLEGDGYQVATAGSYSKAIGMLKRQSYDAVITEMDLEKNECGLELVRSARQMKVPPVIIMSLSRPTRENLRKVLGQRVNYLVVKPIDLSELKAALSRMIARRTSNLLSALA